MSGFTSDYKELFSFAMPATNSENFSVDRLTLRKVLLRGIEESVHFGKQFLRYETNLQGKITAYFQDGTSVTGDLLVGADGGNSKVRQQFLPHAKRVKVGINTIGGKVPYNESTKPLLPPKLCPGMAQVFGPADSTFMFLATHSFTLPEGTQDEIQFKQELDPTETKPFLLCGVAARTEKWDVEEDDPRLHSTSVLNEMMKEKVKNWHPNFRQIVELVEPESLQWLTIQSSEPVDQWPTNINITLLGDAIHSMTPYMGIGANTALEDAKDLTETLVLVKERKKDLFTALHEYETKMLKRGFSRVKWSRTVCRLCHAENWLLILIRRLFLTIFFLMRVIRARFFR